MEQFNYVKDHRRLDDPAGYTFIRALNFMSEEDKLKVFGQSHDNQGNVDIELTVAGVQVPFVKVIESIWSSFKKVTDEDVREAALKLIQGSKLAGLLQAIEYAEQQIVTELDKLGFDHE